MGDVKGAPAVLFNFPLQSFSLYITLKSGIAAAGGPIPSEQGRFGECLNWQLEEGRKQEAFCHICSH